MCVLRVDTIELAYFEVEPGYITCVKGTTGKNIRSVSGQRVLKLSAGSGRTAPVYPEGRSKYDLKIKINEVTFWVNMDRFAKGYLGGRRLTKNLRAKIESTMPNQVDVEKHQKKNGIFYYVLTENSAEQWAKLCS